MAGYPLASIDRSPLLVRHATRRYNPSDVRGSNRMPRKRLALGKCPEVPFDTSLDDPDSPAIARESVGDSLGGHGAGFKLAVWGNGTIGDAIREIGFEPGHFSHLSLIHSRHPFDVMSV